MIAWFFTTLRTYPEIAIFLTLALGYYFGKFTFKGIGLGAVTATLLAGVLIGQNRDHDRSTAQGDRLPHVPVRRRLRPSARSSSAVSPGWLAAGRFFAAVQWRVQPGWSSPSRRIVMRRAYDLAA